MKNYEFLNGVIKDMGFDKMTLKCCNDGSIDFAIQVILSENTIEYTLYEWSNDEEIIKGNVSENKMNIFELCKDLERFEIPQISSDMNCWKFIEFISGCNSIEEISLKMQLIGL